MWFKDETHRGSARRIIAIASFGVLVAACGSAEPPQTTVTNDPTPTETATNEVTAADSPSPTQTPTPTPTPTPTLDEAAANEPEPEPEPEPQEDCHPSYDPCVPIASDADCEGGSGDGPVYTGRVRVIGPDEYRLDADDDGIGCE